ncbi:bifunctional (p)ppGpp synthetase/guanosine-3',5'-bis(diphosphate) 3'-pyrophosphohydrolase [Tistrella mobilis]|uniref:RelA/SpoT family protein n=1 Tax=Tistrella mobilis TaxID=171437 RepID=UPI0035574274
MIRQYELVERVKAYDPDVDEAALNRAYVYAMKMHGSQKRASGDPYFLHPLEVAGILTELKLDSRSIVTALLHDTIEDTPATLDEIEQIFGAEVARLVDGVTKLSKIELQSEQAKQAENFRKLLLAMSDDIRVLLVKLADRLHNMRTLHYIAKPEKRRRIALETLEIYAPLAERIGMQAVKDELDDLAFKELHGDARDSILKRLSFLRENGSELVARIVSQMKAVIAETGIAAEIYGREKRPYSIWRKMQRKNVVFEQLSDIMAFRVTVDNIRDCYAVLGAVHGAYRMVPGRFKDFISNAKPNGYRSLHTTVIGPERQRIEIQIRTREMHEVAEYGVAAHWLYKQESGGHEGRQYRWIRGLLDILEQASNPEEFLEHTKLEMFQDQVFCFSPKGDLIALPRGATPIDFAYAVHSEIGDTCVGAKINGRMMPLRTQLQNGDQIEIITSKAQTPSPAWERFVVTGKARSRIRRFIRLREREQYVSLGRAILQKTFRQEQRPLTEKGLDRALRVFTHKTLEDLYAAVGKGDITARQVIDTVFPEARAPKEEDETGNVVPLKRMRSGKSGVNGHAIPIRGLIPGMAVHYAGCCHPIPGDRIVGIVATGKGVTIHTIDCETLEQYVDEPERWLDVAWDTGSTGEAGHTARLAVMVSNEPGGLAALTTMIAKNYGNITNLKITNRTSEFFEMIVDVEVHDVKHLTHIIAALRADPMINSVDRARG